MGNRFYRAIYNIIPMVILLGTIGLVGFTACDTAPPTSDQIQTQQQETMLHEGTNAVGMPAIHNFRERRLLKDIYESRDSDGLTTYTYVQSEMTGKLVFFCDSIGFPLPGATQFTSPQKVEQFNRSGGGYENVVLPQADPNGLFSPAAAEGTWVMCKDPNGSAVKAVYSEPKLVTSPFKLKADYSAKD